MKSLILLLFLVTNSLWARPVVLISYYDSFGNAPFNNSERVALALKQTFDHPDAAIEVKLCPLQTVFDKSYAQLEDCLKVLDKTPALYLGLGEGKCNLKVETVVRNMDKTFGPDNEGNERNKTEIIPNAPAFMGMRYPLAQMYCGLSQKERSVIEVSNNAGSFVCNNTAFQLSTYYPELQSGFAHVPSNSCRKLENKNRATVKALAQMLVKGVEFLDTHFTISPKSPHSSNEVRLPILRTEITELRNAYANDKCMNEFFKRNQGVDERGFWSFLN